MANISRRRTGELTRALFHILKAQPEGMRASDALAALSLVPSVKPNSSIASETFDSCH